MAGEQLILRDFGPISEATIDVRPLTVFIGPQATGKSLAAQTLCLMRGLGELVLPPEPVARKPGVQETLPIFDAASAEKDLADDPVDALDKTLDWWFGARIRQYVGPQGQLAWVQPGKVAEEMNWGDAGRLQINETLRTRVEQILSPGEKGQTSRRYREQEAAEQIYIPAGRSLYSFIPITKAFVWESRLGAPWPGYVRTFYATLGDAIGRCYEARRDGAGARLPESIQNQLTTVMRGNLFYDPRGVRLYVRRRKAVDGTHPHPIALPPMNLASGQMETWPLGAILEALWLSPESVRGTQLYIEEPEAHLHPAAQWEIVNLLVMLVEEHGMQLVMTTHSPYILYALNNSLMRHKLGNQPVPDKIAQIPVLSPENVAAYRFGYDKPVQNIFDEAETKLIIADDLDDVAADLGADFSEIQELLLEKPGS